MPYTPTTFVNGQAPAISAANLNKLTNELKSQALAKGVSHTLPTWADGVAPALTDAIPWNEMERVLEAVAVSLGLSYTKTVWGDAWSPARNATNLNKMETQAQANRATIDTPPPVGTVFFRGNFETGNFNQFLYMAAENTGYSDPNYNHGFATLQDSTAGGTVASGRYALKIDLEADGTKPGRVDGVTPDYTITLGQDLYYTTEFYLPANWSRPFPFPNWCIIGQYCSQQPNIVAQCTLNVNQDSMRLALQTGAANPAGGGAQFNNGGAPTGGMPDTWAILSPNMNTQVWHQLIMRVKVAVNSTGVWQIWWRRRGEPNWTQTCNLTGFPTLHWNSNTGAASASMTCRDFLNIYRQQTNAPITLFHDNFCRASTFAAAEACFTNTSP